MDNDSRNWGMAAHFGGAANSFFMPSFGWIAPGLVYLLNKDKPDVRKHASEALQFQLAMTGAIWVLGLIGGALCFLAPFTWALGGIAWLASIGYGAFAGIQVSNSEQFKYPLLGDDLPR